MRQEISALIFQIAKEKDAFATLEKHLSTLSRQTLGENLIECGILPEMFAHDSSEEKLWAKFSDIILARALNFLGIEAQVLGARGNSADVYAQTRNYTIVGDAKTFRLSRTAKNQKDFKVTALDTWRKGNNFALLLAPLLQYPTKISQIYTQAIDKNVTLLSYTHLHFLLDFYTGQDLQSLWETGQRLASISEKAAHPSAQIYWAEIDRVVCQIVGQNGEKLQEYKQLEIAKTKEVGNEGIAFWQNKIASYQGLSQAEAIVRLIKAEKIEAKIKTIQKAISLKAIYEHQLPEPNS